MRFFSDKEIKELYDFSLNFSGYQKINDFSKDLWLKFVLSGYTDLPPGFLARLAEKITHTVLGSDNSNTRNQAEYNLIETIARSQGFKQIEGEFIMGGNRLDKNKLFLCLEKIFDKIDSFSKQNLKFTEKDLKASFQINNLNIENKENGNILDLENLMLEASEEVLKYNDLIDEEDIFEIKNPELFLSDQRARKLYKVMNKILKEINYFLIGEISLKPESDYIIAKYGEEQVLPVGGYDSLINKGDISSLLSSELAYIDDTQSIDYFDYKYMQKELLYYKREEGSIFRMRRSILLDIELDQASEHEKNLALIFAFCLAIIEKLVSVFTKDIIEIHLVFSGNLPSSMTYALNFFKYFITKQKYEDNVFIHNKTEKLKAFEKDDYQNWTIGKKPIKDEKFIQLNFPSFDILSSLDEKNKARIIADTINNIVEEVAEVAGR